MKWCVLKNDEHFEQALQRIFCLSLFVSGKWLRAGEIQLDFRRGFLTHFHNKRISKDIKEGKRYQGRRRHTFRAFNVSLLMSFVKENRNDL